MRLLVSHQLTYIATMHVGELIISSFLIGYDFAVK